MANACRNAALIAARGNASARKGSGPERGIRPVQSPAGGEIYAERRRNAVSWEMAPDMNAVVAVLCRLADGDDAVLAEPSGGLDPRPATQMGMQRFSPGAKGITLSTRTSIRQPEVKQVRREGRQALSEPPQRPPADLGLECLGGGDEVGVKVRRDGREARSEPRQRLRAEIGFGEATVHRGRSPAAGCPASGTGRLAGVHARAIARADRAGSVGDELEPDRPSDSLRAWGKDGIDAEIGGVGALGQLQFHTPESYQAKNENHDLYKAFRAEALKSSPDDNAQTARQESMRETCRRIPAASRRHGDPQLANQTQLPQFDPKSTFGSAS
jgi:hypothetical protein